MAEKQPTTVLGWQRQMSRYGMSTRPFPTDDSDLIHPNIYPDPLDIKPERVALASIFSVRAYQRTKKLMLLQSDTLSSPSISSITQYQGYDGQMELLVAKHERIEQTFKATMIESLLLDEIKMKTQPGHPAATAYRRLGSILTPLGERYTEAIKIPGTEEIIENPSGFLYEVAAGLDALPGNIGSLLKNANINYYEKFGSSPDIPTLLDIIRSSYETYIKFVASLHKDDSEFLAELDMFLRVKIKGFIISELIDGAIRIKKVILDELDKHAEAQKGKRSKTARCSFLADPEEIEQFLDEPADFEDPLKDAFDLHMDLLAV